MVSDEEILDLWKDPKFEGSFTGANTFRVLLKTNYNYDIPLKRIYSILKTEPNYLKQLKPIRNFPRRKYDVRTIGEVVQVRYQTYLHI